MPCLELFMFLYVKLLVSVLEIYVFCIMNLFKAYIERKKTRGYYKSYYYKNSFYSFDFSERYQAINKFEQSFNTQTAIVFKGKAEFGISQTETGLVLGKPR